MEGNSDVRVVGARSADDLDAGDAPGSAEALARGRLLEQKRKWARRNAAKLKAYRDAYRKTKEYKVIAARNSKDCRERKKRRGVCVDRLREPRSVARLASALRWHRGLDSSNGSFRAATVWELFSLFGVDERVRRGERWSDLGSRHLMADRWLAEHARGSVV